MIENIITWLSSHDYVGTGLALFLAFHTFVKGVRDAFDKTPDVDDNWFEKFATFLGRLAKYLVGVRPKGSTPIPPGK